MERIPVENIQRSLSQAHQCQFPLTRLPFEIQLQIAKHSIVSGRPILVPHTSAEQYVAGAIRWTCSAFHLADLDRHFYEANTFEVVSNEYGRFFEHPMAQHITFINLRLWSIIKRPFRDPAMLGLALQQLKNLRDIRFRAVTFLPGSPPTMELDLVGLSLKTIRGLCWECKALETITILIPSTEIEESVTAWNELLRDALEPQRLWGEDVPQEDRKEFHAVIRKCNFDDVG